MMIPEVLVMRNMTMNKIFVPDNEFKEVENAIKKSGTRFYPFRKISGGYIIEFFDKESPLVCFLLLKYDGIRSILQS